MLPEPDPALDPSGVLNKVLVDLSIGALRRTWGVATGFRRTPALDRKLQRVGRDARGEFVQRFGDSPGVADFFASPEVAGVVDRLIAFELLLAQFRDGPQVAVPTYSAKTQRVREQLIAQGADPHQRSSRELQEASLRRECARVTELWFGADQSVTVAAVFHVLSTLASDTAAVIKAAPDSSQRDLASLWSWLASVEPRIQTMSRVSELTPVLEFEANLRRQVAHHHRLLRAPHLGRDARLQVSEAYVEPRFWSANGERSISTNSLVESIDRTVLLGDPGAGKSSFGSVLCARVARNYEDRIVGARLLTPMFVSLREYGPDLDETSLAEHLEAVARTLYQVTPPPAAIEYLLSQGRLLLVFDGLDEILVSAERRKLRDAIENFSHLYPMTRLVVTARRVGYEFAPLDSEEFDLVGLEHFDAQQVAVYVTKWFVTQEDFSPAEREVQVNSFLRESAEHAGDLRNNPLLLALLCSIYRGEGSIPTSRPAIYQRCVALLLRQWDAMRLIKVDEPLGGHLERTLREVAAWIYNDAELQSGVPERLLVRKCAGFLAELRTGDIEEAQLVAQDFVDYCRERAWVLVELGYSSAREPLFAFAHRTFLEFFAAQHLEKRSRTPSDLAHSLLPLVRSATTVVPQLALQLADDSRHDAGDEVLAVLLNVAEDAEDGLDVAVLDFVVDSLRFIAPRPVTVRRIARHVALGILKPTLSYTTRDDGYDEEERWGRAVTALVLASSANARSVAQGFEEGLLRATRQSDRDDALDVVAVALRTQPEAVRHQWSDTIEGLVDRLAATPSREHRSS